MEHRVRVGVYAQFDGVFGDEKSVLEVAYGPEEQSRKSGVWEGEGGSEVVEF